MTKDAWIRKAALTIQSALHSVDKMDTECGIPILKLEVRVELGELLDKLAEIEGELGK